ncbi:ankyrin repeat-containing domain protein [Aspergillus nidulans var. acristatus]
MPPHINPPLYDAAKKGETDIVRELLEQGEDVNVGLQNGWTPLHAASFYNKPNVVRLLLEFNANLEARLPRTGCRPLHKAAEAGTVSVMKLLVDNGADIEARSNEWETPLWIAARRNRRGAVRFLLDQKALVNAANNFNDTPLHAAATAAHFQMVQDLIEAGADYEVQNNAGKTPLYKAAQFGSENILQYLLDQGADPTKPTVEGWTALHITAFNGHTRAAALLVKDGRIGLDDGTVSYGFTPLHKAVESNSLQIIRLLLDAGANINSLTSENVTPLYLAAKLDRPFVVEELLRRGARVNLTTRANWSSLHVAISKGHKDVIKRLLKYREKLDLDLRTKEGDTALSMAQANGHQDVVEWLSNPKAIELKQQSMGGITGGMMARSTSANSDAWFQKLSELADILSPEEVTEKTNVKIAIIDSGILPDHPNMGQVKDYRDFVDGQDAIKCDNTGHGSTGVDLICRVLSDHNPEIYVARVFERSQGTEVEANRIATAMKHARMVWGVDIIALAAGFDNPTEELATQVSLARINKVLIFAAASNTGNLNRITFPGRATKDVICMFATDANAKALNQMNPAPNPDSRFNFAILGEKVYSRPGAEPQDGTSVSTFIAAAVAGLILDFARHDDVKEYIIPQENLKTVTSMEHIFQKMAVDAHEGYDCMAPWKLCRSMIGERASERRYIAGLLAEAANRN